VRPDWFENDPLFRAQLEAGHAAAEIVANRLRSEGIVVEVTPLRWRENIEARKEFVDEFDLRVGSLRPCLVDVKSRNLKFSGPRDFPYPTAFVDTVSGWEAKTHKPVAIILVSAFTHGMAVIGRSTRPHWVARPGFDNVRKIQDSWYHIPREKLETFEKFVLWLRAREDP
jgi:hypothetical protein